MHISGQRRQSSLSQRSFRFDNEATSGAVHNKLIRRFIKLILNYGRDNCVVLFAAANRIVPLTLNASSLLLFSLYLSLAAVTLPEDR